MTPSPATTRRAVIAGSLAGLGTASAGCLGRVRNIAGRDGSTQMTLDVYTTPADADPHGIRVARHLEEHLRAVGIDTRVNTMAEADLYRRVLINQDFDIYVGQFPAQQRIDPDALYPFCHSEFNPEPGWQNPFGVTDLTIDDLLEEQRGAASDDRPAVVDDLQREIARQQPFVTVAFPDALTAVQRGRFEGWRRGGRVAKPMRLLSLSLSGDDEGADGTDDGDATGGDGSDRPTETTAEATADGGAAADATLRLVTTDPRVAENRNPIAAEYRRHGTFTELLYDSLIRTRGDERIPWLARDVSWLDEETVRVSLREATWHDGEPVTAADVAFTYAFLSDTSMGNAEAPIPAPRFRGRSTLVRTTDAVDDRTVDVTFADANPRVGLRALTVPILPEHVWSERTNVAAIAGIEVDEQTTDALVWDNPDPVGSGPLRFVEASPGERVVFARSDDHFLDRDPDGVPADLRGKPAFDELLLNLVPSDIAAVEHVADRRADATVSNLGPEAVPRIGREPDATLVSRQSAAFYHVGFNVRSEPLSNPRFRRAVAGLIDKAHVVDEAFQGYAQPAASPLANADEWLADDLRFDGRDPETPFFGTDGALDVEAAREAFREAGYRYGDEGALLVREP
ncbi:hypothetical protein GCM10027435_18980 [Haloparvum alkalitolerans]|uniref:ABC transporter substrate-binding protein n=1 Tax=Haloparvum alkalitolerans TaxID=1042953 RepID=UPI003CF631D8